MIISAPFRENNPRLRAVGTIIASGLFLLLIALWRVQVLHGEHYDLKQENQSLRRIRIPAARGEIVDRNGIVLANNRASYDIAIYLDQPGRIPKKANFVAIAHSKLVALSSLVGLTEIPTDRELTNHYERRRPLPLPVWHDLSPEKVAVFAERNEISGADLIVMPVREYPFGALAAHLIGYVSKAKESDEEDIEKFYYYKPDSVGQQGVEKACDEYLQGSPGGRTIQVNPAGQQAHDLGETPAERGGRVTLTIDVRLQRIMEDALAAVKLPAGKELRGAAVMLDARTGEVLAMASAPGFDLNIFNNPATPVPVLQAVMNNPSSPMFNRAIGGLYPPGSTFKTITLLAGLESGAISPQDTVVCSGSIQIGNWPRPFRCSNHAGHGRIDAYNAIAESCDVWFYEEGLKTGPDAITRMAGEFGLGQPTGFDVGHEKSGIVPTPAWKRARRGEKWLDGNTAQLSIGQSFLLVTPMQMACVAATFANHGTCLHPYVVKRIEASDGQVVHEGARDVRAHLSANPQQLEVVRRAMLGAVQDAHGTASRAAVKGLSIAGKTGTAEYDTKQGRLNCGWFIGFAPYDQPQVAVAVLIEDAVSGGQTAAPVAGKIFAQVFGRNAGDAGVAEPGAYAD